MLRFYSYDCNREIGFRFQHNTPLRGIIGGHHMINLKTEYTDVKDKKHKVEHHIVSDEDKNDKERVVEELFHALTKSGKRISA